MSLKAQDEMARVAEGQPQACPPAGSTASSNEVVAAADWIDHLAADIRDVNPYFHDFERTVSLLIRTAISARGGCV